MHRRENEESAFAEKIETPIPDIPYLSNRNTNNDWQKRRGEASGRLHSYNPTLLPHWKMEIDEKKKFTMENPVNEFIRTRLFLEADKHEKRADIQGLRTIGLLLIWCFHYSSSTFPNGYLGIEIFFVVSGYLAAQAFAKEASIGVWSILEFYYRRMKKIVPCFYITILFTLIAMIFLMSIPWMENNQNSAIDALLFRLNYVNTEKFKDSFNITQIGPNTDLFFHSWVLSVEAQFYIAVPLLFIFIRKLLLEEERFRFLFLMGLAVASWVYGRKLFLVPFYFDSIGRVWQFLLGIIAFNASFQQRRKPQDRAKPELWEELLLHILVFIVFCGCFCDIDYYPVQFRFLVSATTAFSLILGSHSQTLLLSSPLFTSIGNASYSLFLVHWPVLKFVRYCFSAQTVFPDQLASVCEFMIIVLLTVTLGLILYQFERRQSKWEKGCNFAMCGSMLVLVYALAMYSGEIGKLFIGSHKEAVLGNLRQAHNQFIYPDANYTSFEGFGGAPWGLATFPPGNGSLNVLVIGNIYAISHMRLVKKVLKKNYKSMTLFATQANQVFNLKYDRALATANQHLVAKMNPDVLIVAARTGGWPKDNTTTGRTDLLFHESNERLQLFSVHAKHILILGALPTYPKNFLDVFIEKLQRNSPLEGTAINRTDFDEKTEGSRDLLMATVRKCRKCQLLNAVRVFVDKKSNQILTFDPSSHLSFIDNQGQFTNVGLDWMKPVYEEKLNSILRGPQKQPKSVRSKKPTRKGWRKNGLRQKAIN